ncbi:MULTISPECIES: hypothetical protein [unclassified Sedimentibacter]|uniref:hypothetical protein n=1 Tax=unclassified Sedimentibacter TaxID=2649220 RepID=UPI0027E0E89A|nr:hypothetical protein [Sedimentibacter sp. MB35-C1]WMJ78788.1 hypothetical protein RBQ61_07630 [Sedimentibacter sp. MB35-C1]
MKLILWMKTGFFKKTPYSLGARGNNLLLIPTKAEDAEQIILKQEGLLSVTLTQRKYPELEIQAQDAVYVGVFEEGVDFEEVASYLKEHLKTKIICEYKGGE